MKWGTARKFRSLPGIEPRATDHPPLFLYKITSPLPESTGFDVSSLLGCYLRVQLANCYKEFRIESSSTLQPETQTSRTPSVDCTHILMVYMTTLS